MCLKKKKIADARGCSQKRGIFSRETLEKKKTRLLCCYYFSTPMIMMTMSPRRPLALDVTRRPSRKDRQEQTVSWWWLRSTVRWGQWTNISSRSTAVVAYSWNKDLTWWWWREWVRCEIIDLKEDVLVLVTSFFSFYHKSAQNLKQKSDWILGGWARRRAYFAAVDCDVFSIARRHSWRSPCHS